LIHCSRGDIIQIKPGVYFEELPIVKSIRLIGQDKVFIFPPKSKRILTDSQVTLFSPDDDLPGAGVTFENLTFDLKGEKKLSVVHAFSGNMIFRNCNFVGGDVSVKGSGSAIITLEKCTVSLAKRYGLFFGEQSTLYMKDCHVKENGYDGIYTCENSLVVVEKTVIERNSYNGVSLNSCFRSVFVGNTISKNKWDGISIGVTSSVIILKENEFLDNSGLGCYFSKGKGNRLLVEYDETLDYENVENTKGISNDVVIERNAFKGNQKGTLK
jgi:parallel beta-helix repeat protein